jgi:hypothetical protein
MALHGFVELQTQSPCRPVPAFSLLFSAFLNFGGAFNETGQRLMSPVGHVTISAGAT